MRRADWGRRKTTSRAKPLPSLLGRKLQRNDAILHYIESRFRSLGREMPEVNVAPGDGAGGRGNFGESAGDRAGIVAGRLRATLSPCLPGPPRELKPLFREQVLPRLERRASGVRLHHREIRVTGLGESHVEQRILPIYQRYPEVNTTILAAPGETQIHLRLWTDDAQHAKKTLDEIVQGFEIALTDRIFSEDGRSLEEVVAHELTLNNATIAAAESCTGRLAGAAVDEHRGQLVVFSWRRGVLQQRTEDRVGGRAAGDDSGEGRGQRRKLPWRWRKASAGAWAARSAWESRVSPGLGGGSEEKPVGTVHVAISHAGGVKERGVRFPGRARKYSLASVAGRAGPGARAFPLQRPKRHEVVVEKGLSRAPVRCAGDSLRRCETISPR